MFVRIFINSNSKDEASEIYNGFIEKTRKFILEESIEKIEPYWKYDDSYVIEANIKLTCAVDSDEFEEFLSLISDRWTVLGHPIDNVLASLTTDGCKYIIKGISMINIFFLLRVILKIN